LVALTTFSDLVGEAREKALADARAAGVTDAGAAGLPNDPTALHEGGTGAAAYSDAVATYLALAIGRSADFWSSLATWRNAAKNELVAHTFTRNALPMTWDFGEASPFSSSGGNFFGNLQFVAKSIDGVVATGCGSVISIDAQKK
jgi:putative DNA methylase